MVVVDEHPYSRNICRGLQGRALGDPKPKIGRTLCVGYTEHPAPKQTTGSACPPPPPHTHTQRPPSHTHTWATEVNAEGGIKQAVGRQRTLSQRQHQVPG